MKKSVKLIISGLIIAALVFFGVYRIFAENTITVSLVSDSESYNAGDEVWIAVKLDDVNIYGLRYATFLITYDDEVFDIDVDNTDHVVEESISPIQCLKANYDITVNNNLITITYNPPSTDHKIDTLKNGEVLRLKFVAKKAVNELPSFQINTSNLQQVKSDRVNASVGSINNDYELAVRNKKIVVSKRNCINCVGNSTKMEFNIDVTDILEDLSLKDEYVYGDINLDGVINAKDATVLELYINSAGTEEEYVLSELQSELADVNNDGENNSDDLDIIRKHLAGGYVIFDTSRVDELNEGRPLNDKILFGDINGDGTLNAKDVTTLRNYISTQLYPDYQVDSFTINQKVSSPEDIMDLNGDGQIDSLDVTYLRKKLAGGYEIINTRANTKYTPNKEYYIGDVNLDGNVTSRDVTLLRRYLSEDYNIQFTNLQIALADKNGDSIVNEDDVDAIRNSIGSEPVQYTAELQSVNTFKIGDINTDGLINAKDKTIINRYISGTINLTDLQKKLADLNEDGKVNNEDGTMLAQYLAGGHNIVLDREYSTSSTLGIADVIAKPSISFKITRTRLIGDINLDGVINAKDLTILRRSFTNKYGIVLNDSQREVADVNGDNLINETDEELLRNYLASKGITYQELSLNINKETKFVLLDNELDTANIGNELVEDVSIVSGDNEKGCNPTNDAIVTKNGVSSFNVQSECKNLEGGILSYQFTANGVSAIANLQTVGEQSITLSNMTVNNKVTVADSSKVYNNVFSTIKYNITATNFDGDLTLGENNVFLRQDGKDDIVIYPSVSTTSDPINIDLNSSTQTSTTCNNQWLSYTYDTDNNTIEINKPAGALCAGVYKLVIKEGDVESTPVTITVTEGVDLAIEGTDYVIYNNSNVDIENKTFTLIKGFNVTLHATRNNDSTLTKLKWTTKKNAIDYGEPTYCLTSTCDYILNTENMNAGEYLIRIDSEDGSVKGPYYTITIIDPETTVTPVSVYSNIDGNTTVDNRALGRFINTVAISHGSLNDVKLEKIILPNTVDSGLSESCYSKTLTNEGNAKRFEINLTANSNCSFSYGTYKVKYSYKVGDLLNSTLYGIYDIELKEYKYTNLSRIKDSIEIPINSTYTLAAGTDYTINEDATYKRFTYTSSNTSIATVDENGKITPVSANKNSYVTITMCAKEYTSSTSTSNCYNSIYFTITVKDNGIRTTKYLINESGSIKSINRVDPNTYAYAFTSYFSTDTGITMRLVDKNDNILESNSIVGTGMKAQFIKDSVVFAEYNIIVKGDVDGDGDITSVDLLKIQRDILKLESLSGIYRIAADAYGDDKIDTVDLMKLKRYILKLLSNVWSD